MPWNQPGGSDGKDPWGSKNNQEGPPDLDEVVKSLQKKFSSIFGGGKGSDTGNRGSSDNSFGAKGVLVVLVLLLGVWLATGFYTVQQGETAVILRFGSFDRATTAGLHWRFPTPIETKIIVNTEKVQTVEVGYRSSANNSRQTVQRESLMLTEDENIIDIAFAVQYRISDANNFLFNVSDQMDVLVRSSTEAAVREVVGKTSMDDVITSGRSIVASKTSEILQRILDRYESGIEIVSVDMQHALPPSEVKPAFDDAVKAREDEVRYKNEAEAYSNDVIPRARGKSARIIQESEAYKATVIAQAEGEASRFSSILKEYNVAPEVSRERMYLESMEKVLEGSNLVMVDQKNSNNIMYLPLDRMLNRYETPEVVSDINISSEQLLDARKKIDEYRQRDNRAGRTDRR
ncbi:MAG: FtsH protease activity modulator HflK [Gammaproteobacteria bacterium]|nr:FtsH protease activity modulator HflK [Gammaproteobacteria bacterium]MDX2488406.1 FtsH protease activity modulator HflK [Gammaproteobacteria bacterium]